jgi:signal transduction histidine kinase
MSSRGEDKTRRVLIIDDNPDIHKDFMRILMQLESGMAGDLRDMEADLFGNGSLEEKLTVQFHLSSAMQGKDAHKMVQEAVANNEHYSLAFVDMRMPPGWDGLETISHLWKVDPKLEIVICTAYSDYSLTDIFNKVDASDQLLVLKKPFEPIEVIQIATALTEKWNLARQAEMELKDMERSVEEQTRELYAASEYMRLLANEAKAANELKSSFLANMSHGIRTPLNDVIGLSSMLAESDLDTEQQDYVRIVRKSGMALLGLIDDILDLSKIEAGEIDFEETDFNLRDTVEEVLDVISLNAYEKDLEVICIVHPDVPHVVNSDPGRIRQILINLANNAIKFTERGEVAIEVRIVDDKMNLERYGLTNEYEGFLSSKPKGRVLVQFSVLDTGIGIPQEAQTTLFEAFTQADSSTTRKHGGTGLGLSVTRHLAHKMHGSVGLLSEMGEGSEFWVTAQLMLPDVTDTSAFEALPESDKNILAENRLLIVEQNDRVHRFYDMLLSTWGCQFKIVDDPKAAYGLLDMAAATGEHYGLVVIDGKLVTQSSVDLYDPIIANTGLASLKIIETHPIDEKSGRNTSNAARNRISLGKPIKESNLLSCILTTLKNEIIPAAPATVLPDTSFAKEMNILVVEDNRTNQKVIAGMLGHFGCSVDVAANGAEAMATIACSDIDLVLMDIIMPVMDGYAAAQAIRDLEMEQAGAGNEKRIPIIAMTANAMIGDREKCIAAGMDDYLAKPISMAILTDKLVKWGKPVGSDTTPVSEMEDVVTPVADVSSSTSPITSLAINLNDLKARLGGDQEIVAAAVSAFIEDATGLIQSLRDQQLEREGAAHACLVSQLYSGACTTSANALRDAVGHYAATSTSAEATNIEQEFVAMERELELFEQEAKEAVLAR